MFKKLPNLTKILADVVKTKETSDDRFDMTKHPNCVEEDLVEKIVVDLNTDANVTIIFGNYAPIILAPAENL